VLLDLIQQNQFRADLALLGRGRLAGEVVESLAMQITHEGKITRIPEFRLTLPHSFLTGWAIVSD